MRFLALLEHEDAPISKRILVLWLLLIGSCVVCCVFRSRRWPRNTIDTIPTISPGSLRTDAKHQRCIEPGPGSSSISTRLPGQWQGSNHKFPAPPPYPSWSIESTKPLPYRTFNHGPKYNVTMGLRLGKQEDWMQLDNEFPKFHATKKRRMAERGSKCCRTLPEAYPAAIELLHELAEYLSARYPSLYERTAVGLDNLWSGESFNIIERPLTEDPMTMCGRLVQDDVALMIERKDGQYYLMAGSVLLAGSWRLKDKLGMPLSEIHTSGGVPQFRERLEAGMVKFFKRLRCEEMYRRNNYLIQTDNGLGWSQSLGNEDAESTAEVSSATFDNTKGVEDLWFRSEQQSLRRLPKTGAVCFGIRTYFLPVTEMACEDYVPGRLASAIRSWGPDISEYKGKERYGGVVLEYLDREHEKQVARGLDLANEDEVRRYPW